MHLTALARWLLKLFFLMAAVDICNRCEQLCDSIGQSRGCWFN